MILILMAGLSMPSKVKQEGRETGAELVYWKPSNWSNGKGWNKTGCQTPFSNGAPKGKTGHGKDKRKKGNWQKGSKTGQKGKG